MNSMVKALDQLGASVASYEGHAEIHLSAGNAVECEFTARQLTTGEIVLGCEVTGSHDPFTAFNLRVSDAITEVRGETLDGAAFQTLDDIVARNIPESAQGTSRVGNWIWLGPQGIRVAYDEGTGENCRFGLTNVCPPPSSTMELELPGGDPSSVELRRVEEGREKYTVARATRGVEVTCELVFRGVESQALTRATEDVCYLLSIAQGSRVQWIYYDRYAGSQLIKREHRDRRTSPYAPHPAIDIRYPHNPRWPETFVRATYRRYTDRRDAWKLDEGPIDWYLEAKAETGYLESRAAKLAVALESLTHRYLQSPEAQIHEHVIDQSCFDELESPLKQAVKKVLKEKRVESKDRGAIYGNMNALNRTSFRRIIRSLAKEIGLDPLTCAVSPPRRAEDLFIDSRNCLVHQGQFYCRAVEREEIEPRSDPLESVAEEYFFMVTVLDRIFLRLVGYTGEHWSGTEFAERKLVSIE